jgi:hypothetical protein
VAAFLADPGRTAGQARDRLRAWLARFLGLDDASRRLPGPERRRGAAAEIGD